MWSPGYCTEKPLCAYEFNIGIVESILLLNIIIMCSCNIKILIMINCNKMYGIYELATVIIDRCIIISSQV